MSIPELIEAKDIPNGNEEPHGIIYLLKQQVSNVLSYVVPTSNTGTISGSIDNIITRNDVFQTNDNDNAYVQIEFKERYVFATHYSFKGWSVGGWRYAKEWYLHGFDSTSETPVLITTNTSVGSTFCGSDSYCNSGNWGTFAIPSTQRSFRFFRITIKTSSYSTGIYSKDGRGLSKPKRTYCFRSCPIKQRSPTLTVTKVIFICTS